MAIWTGAECVCVCVCVCVCKTDSTGLEHIRKMNYSCWNFCTSHTLVGSVAQSDASLCSLNTKPDDLMLVETNKHQRPKTHLRELPLGCSGLRIQNCLWAVRVWFPLRSQCCYNCGKSKLWFRFDPCPGHFHMLWGGGWKWKQETKPLALP